MPLAAHIAEQATSPKFNAAGKVGSSAVAVAALPGGLDVTQLSLPDLRVKLQGARKALEAMKMYHATTKAGPREKREAPLRRHEDLVEALEVELASREDSASAGPAVTLGRRRGFGSAAAGSVEDVLGRSTQSVVDDLLELVTQLDPMEVSDVVFAARPANSARTDGVAGSACAAAAASAAAALATKSSSSADLAFVRWVVLTLNDPDLGHLLTLHPKCPPALLEALLMHAPDEFFSLLAQDDAASLFARCIEHRLRATASLLLAKLPPDAIVTIFGDSNTTSGTSATRLMLQAMQFGWTEIVEAAFSLERAAVFSEHDNWSKAPQQRRQSDEPKSADSPSANGGDGAKKGAASHHHSHHHVPSHHPNHPGANGAHGNIKAGGRAVWPEVPPAAFHFLIQTNRMLAESAATIRESDAASDGDAILTAAASTTASSSATREAAGGGSAARRSMKGLKRAATSTKSTALADQKTANEIPERGLLYDPAEHGDGDGDDDNFDLGDVDRAQSIFMSGAFGSGSGGGGGRSLRGLGQYASGAALRRGSRIAVALSIEHLSTPALVPSHHTTRLFRPAPLSVAPIPSVLADAIASLVGLRAPPAAAPPKQPSKPSAESTGPPSAGDDLDQLNQDVVDHQALLASPLIQLPFCDREGAGDVDVAAQKIAASRKASPRRSTSRSKTRGRSPNDSRRGSSASRRSPTVTAAKILVDGVEAAASAAAASGQQVSPSLTEMHPTADDIPDFPVTVRADTPVYRARTYFTAEVPLALLLLPGAHETCRFGWCRGGFEATGCAPSLLGADPEGNSFGVSFELFRPPAQESSPKRAKSPRARSPSGRGGGGVSPNRGSRVPMRVTKTTSSSLGAGEDFVPKRRTKVSLGRMLAGGLDDAADVPVTVRDQAAASRVFHDDTEADVQDAERPSAEAPWRFIIRKHFRGTTMPVGTSMAVNLLQCGPLDTTISVGCGLDTIKGEASFSANFNFTGVAFDGFVVPEGASPACAWYPATSLHAKLPKACAALSRAEQFNLLSSLVVGFSFAQTPPCAAFDPLRERIAKRRRRRASMVRKASMASDPTSTTSPAQQHPPFPVDAEKGSWMTTTVQQLRHQQQQKSPTATGTPSLSPSTSRPQSRAQSRGSVGRRRSSSGLRVDDPPAKDNTPGVVKVVEAPWRSISRQDKVDHLWRLLTAYAASLAATRLSTATVSSLVGGDFHDAAKEAATFSHAANRFALAVLDVVEAKKNVKEPSPARPLSPLETANDLAKARAEKIKRLLEDAPAHDALLLRTGGWPSEMAMVTMPEERVPSFLDAQRDAIGVLNELDVVKPHLTPALLDVDLLLDGVFYGVFAQRPTDLSLLPQLPSGPEAEVLDSDDSDEDCSPHRRRGSGGLGQSSDDGCHSSSSSDVEILVPNISGNLTPGTLDALKPYEGPLDGHHNVVPDGPAWDDEILFPSLEAAAEPYPRDAEESMPLSWAPVVVRYLTVLKRMRRRRRAMLEGTELEEAKGTVRPPYPNLHRPMDPLPHADFPDVLPYMAAKAPSIKAPPLCACLRYNFTSFARVLASVPSVNVNLPDEQGFTPVMLAILNGQYALLRFLIVEREASVRPINYAGYTALHLALLLDRDEAIDVMLRHPTAVTADELNALTPCKSNCVSLAVKKSRARFVEAFIQRGALAGVPDKNHVTPLLFACRTSMYDIAALLLESGQYTGREHRAALNARERRQPRGSALLYAALDGNQSMCERLLKCGADAKVGFEPFNIAPIHAAVHSENLDCAAFLIRSTACDPSAVESHTSSTALHFVMERGMHALVVLALNTPGVDPNIQNRAGHTPLMLAILHGHVECAVSYIQLTKKKLRVEATDKTGSTALTLAAQCGLLPVVEALVDVGNADLNFVNQSGHTPLAAAIHYGHPDAAEIMIHFVQGRRIDFEIERQHVPRAIELAVARRYIRLCRLMLASGARASAELVRFIRAPEHDRMQGGPGPGDAVVDSSLDGLIARRPSVRDTLLTSNASSRRASVMSTGSAGSEGGGSFAGSPAAKPPLSGADGHRHGSAAGSPGRNLLTSPATQRGGVVDKAPSQGRPPSASATAAVPSLVRRLSAAPPPPVAPPRVAASQADLGINRELNPYRCRTTGRTRATAAVLALVLHKVQQPAIAVTSANMALMAKTGGAPTSPQQATTRSPPAADGRRTAAPKPDQTSPAAGKAGTSPTQKPAATGGAARETLGSIPLRNVTAMLDAAPTGADAVAMLELVTKPGRDRNGDYVDRGAHAIDEHLAALSPRAGASTRSPSNAGGGGATPMNASLHRAEAGGASSPIAAVSAAERRAYQSAWQVASDAFASINPSCTSDTAIRGAAQAALRLLQMKVKEEQGESTGDAPSQPFAVAGRSGTSQVFATESVGYEFGAPRGEARLFELLRQRASSEKLADACRRYGILNFNGAISTRGVTLLHIAVLTGNESATEYLVDGGAATDFTLLHGAESPAMSCPSVQRIVAEGSFAGAFELPDTVHLPDTLRSQVVVFGHEVASAPESARAILLALNDGARRQLVTDMVQSPAVLIKRASKELAQRSAALLAAEAEGDPFSVRNVDDGSATIPAVLSFVPAPALLSRREETLPPLAGDSTIFADELSARKGVGKGVNGSMQHFLLTSPLATDTNAREVLVYDFRSPEALVSAVANRFDESALSRTASTTTTNAGAASPPSLGAGPLAGSVRERLAASTNAEAAPDSPRSAPTTDNASVYDSPLVCACKIGLEQIVRLILVAAANGYESVTLPSPGSPAGAACQDAAAAAETAPAMSFPMGRVAVPLADRLRNGLLTVWDGPFIAAPMRHLELNAAARDGIVAVHPSTGAPRSSSRGAASDREGSGTPVDPFAKFGVGPNSSAGSEASGRESPAAMGGAVISFKIPATSGEPSRASSRASSIGGGEPRDLVFDFGGAAHSRSGRKSGRGGGGRSGNVRASPASFPRITTTTLLHVLIDTPHISDDFVIEAVQLLGLEFSVTSIAAADVDAIAMQRAGVGPAASVDSAPIRLGSPIDRTPPRYHPSSPSTTSPASPAVTSPFGRSPAAPAGQLKSPLELESLRIATRFSALAAAIRAKRIRLLEWALDHEALTPTAYAHDVIWLLAVQHVPDLLPALLVLWSPEESSSAGEATTPSQCALSGGGEADDTSRLARKRSLSFRKEAEPRSGGGGAATSARRSTTHGSPARTASQLGAGRRLTTSTRGGGAGDDEGALGKKAPSKARLSVAAATAAVMATSSSRRRSAASELQKPTGPPRQPPSVALFAALLHRVLDLPKERITPLLELLCVELLVQHPSIRWDIPDMSTAAASGNGGGGASTPGQGGMSGRSLLAQAAWRQCFRLLEYLLRVALPAKPTALTDRDAIGGDGECPLNFLQRAAFTSADIDVATAICIGVEHARDRRVFVETVARHAHPAVLARLAFLVKVSGLSLPATIAAAVEGSGTAQSGKGNAMAMSHPAASTLHQPQPPSGNASMLSTGAAPSGRRRSIGFATPTTQALRAADASALEHGDAVARLFTSVLYLVVAGTSAHRGKALSKQLEGLKPQSSVLAHPFVAVTLLSLYGHTHSSRVAIRQSMPSATRHTQAIGWLPPPPAVTEQPSSSGQGRRKPRPPADGSAAAMSARNRRSEQEKDRADREAEAQRRAEDDAKRDAQTYAAPRLDRDALKPTSSVADGASASFVANPSVSLRAGGAAAGPPSNSAQPPPAKMGGLWAAAGSALGSRAKAASQGADDPSLTRFPSAILAPRVSRLMLKIAKATTLRPDHVGVHRHGSVLDRRSAADDATRLIDEWRVALFHLVQRVAFGTHARAIVPLNWHMYPPATSTTLRTLKDRVARITPARRRGSTESPGASDIASAHELDDDEDDVSLDGTLGGGSFVPSVMSRSQAASDHALSVLLDGAANSTSHHTTASAVAAAPLRPPVVMMKLEGVAEKALDSVHNKLFECIADLTTTYVTAELTTGITSLTAPHIAAGGDAASSSSRGGPVHTKNAAAPGAATLAVSPPSFFAGGSKSPGSSQRRGSITGSTPGSMASVVDVGVSKSNSDHFFGRGLSWLGDVLVLVTKSGMVDVLEVIRTRIAAAERRTREDLRPGQVGQIPTGIARRLSDLAAFRFFHPLPAAATTSTTAPTFETPAKQQHSGKQAPADAAAAESLGGAPTAAAAAIASSPVLATPDLALACGEHDDELLFRGTLFGHMPRLFYAMIVDCRLHFIAAAQKRAHCLEYLLVNSTLARMRDADGAPLIDYVLRDIGGDASREALRAAQSCVRVLLRARAPLSKVALDVFRQHPAYFSMGHMTAPGHGDTLLHTAVLNNQLDVVALLLEDVANRGRWALTANRYGLLPWQYAVSTAVLRRVVDMTVTQATMAGALLKEYQDAKAKLREQADAQGGGGSTKSGTTSLASLALAALALAQEAEQGERGVRPDLFVASIFDDPEEGAEADRAGKAPPTLRVHHAGAPLVQFDSAVVSATFAEVHGGAGMRVAPEVSSSGGFYMQHGASAADFSAPVGQALDPPPQSPESPRKPQQPQQQQQESSTPSGMSRVGSAAIPVTPAVSSANFSAASFTISRSTHFKTISPSVLKELWRRCFVCEGEDSRGRWTNRPSMMVAIKAAQPPAMAARRTLNIFASPQALHAVAQTAAETKRQMEEDALEAAAVAAATPPVTPRPGLHAGAVSTVQAGMVVDPSQLPKPAARKSKSAVVATVAGVPTALPLLQQLLPKKPGVTRAATEPDATSTVDSGMPASAAGAAQPSNQPTPAAASLHPPATSVVAAQEAMAMLVGTAFDHSATHRAGYSGYDRHRVGDLPSAAEWHAAFLVPCEVLRHTDEQRRRLSHMVLDTLLQIHGVGESSFNATLAPVYEGALQDE